MEWLYGLILEIVEYLANGLLDVFSMNLEYFTQAIPITGSIVNIVIASGWALLLGNMVFQASKSMMSGIGLEGEDPKTLFMRTFLFAFLLLVSRQICEIGMGLSGTVIDMLEMPDAVSISLPDENTFGIAASWLLMIVVGVVLMWQIVKLFFTVGERYFLVGFLTITAPWAFSMGGSKSTEDIFKGWVRMFASMCLMMVLNVVFLKILLSALGTMPDDGGIIAWIIFVVAICRVARKIDNIIMRIGLNPASAGEGLGRNILGSVASYVVMRTFAANAVKAISGMTGGAAKTATGGAPPPKAGASSSFFSRNNSQNQHSSHGGAAKHTSQMQTGSTGTPNKNAATASTTNMHSSTVGTASAQTSIAGTTNLQSGTAGLADAHSAAVSTRKTGSAIMPVSATGTEPYHGTHGKAGMIQRFQNQTAPQSISRRSSIPDTPYGARGMTDTDGQKPSESLTVQMQQRGMPMPVIQGINGTQKTIGTAGKQQGELGNAQARFTSVPLNARNTMNTPGTAGIAHSTRLHQGGVNNQIQDGASNVINESTQPVMSVNKTTPGAPPVNKPLHGTHGNVAAENRRSSADLSAKPPQSKQSGAPAKSTASGHGTQPRHGRNVSSISPTIHSTSGSPRDGRNAVSQSKNSSSQAARQSPPARQEVGIAKPETPRVSGNPSSGTAERRPETPSKPAIIKPGDVVKNNIINQGTKRLGSNDWGLRDSGAVGETRKTQREISKKDERSLD